MKLFGGTFLKTKGRPETPPSSPHDLSNSLARKMGIGAELLVPPEELLLGKVVGRGGFAVVHHCQLRGQPAVAKILRPKDIKESDAKLLENEIKIWATISHKHCLALLGACLMPDKYMIVSEYMTGGALQDELSRCRRRGDPPPDTCMLLERLRQISSGLMHLHAMRPHPILHRDVKSANVLVNAEGQMVIADFGLVRYCEGGAKDQMTAETGSYRWMAPEVIRHEPYGPACDVYSYAILAWEMLTYEVPFAKLSPVEAALGVANRAIRPVLPSHTDSKLAPLIKEAWDQDSSKRPTFAYICAKLQAMCEERAREDDTSPVGR